MERLKYTQGPWGMLTRGIGSEQKNASRAQIHITKVLSALWKKQQLICLHTSIKLLANQTQPSVHIFCTYAYLFPTLFGSHCLEHPVFLIVLELHLLEP